MDSIVFKYLKLSIAYTLLCCTRTFYVMNCMAYQSILNYEKCATEVFVQINK